MNWANVFLSPRGRISRLTFWIGFVVVMAVSYASGLLGPVGNLLGFVLLWPQCMIHIKRLHDMGWSGWLLLAPFGLTVVLFAALFATGDFAAPSATGEAEFMRLMQNSPLFLAAMAVGVGFLLWVGLTPGRRTSNRYGGVPA